jgi:hypothetical protein
MVPVQWDELFVRLLDPKTGQLLREHVRQKRGWYRINPKDLSPSELHSALPNGCGEQAGPARTSARVAMPSTARQAELGVRLIRGVLPWLRPEFEPCS